VIEIGKYLDKDYDNKKRFISYWYQKNEVLQFNPKNILEIGIGNGFLSKYLKSRNMQVTTLDISGELKPDIRSSVDSIPLKENEFEMVVCFETLEHLPYESFSKALSEIFRVCKTYTILSLPDVEAYLRLSLKIPKIHEMKILKTVKRIKKPEKIYEPEHFWEIGRQGYNLGRILSDIKNTGFRVIRTYRVFEEPYYRFLILKKTT